MGDKSVAGFREAMILGEVVPFLRGDGAYQKIPESDFAGEDAPTDSWQVLQEVYAEAKTNADIGKVLSAGLSQLLDGSAGDFYLAILYIVRLVMAKQREQLPLQLSLDELLLKAKRRSPKNCKALSEKLVFPNGYVKRAALADIQGWNEVVFLPCCGVDVLSGN